ncbi:putative transposon-encoded protein with Ribonuclease H-like domain and integrase-like domain [Klebsormidium nitens]|uniref:Putative transposon-encoded protein with Ribonuclease H-like domain and integrase-like domain n=1 Tax=Klebsormidium nitens TaxID=105231 RepID=A0A1Y1IRP2_KLENI|nr:putative transposon-encoded protein with Ribonuclease H-like domain and integrase-like domain [Klebsormidium nitens]|eukprot:GAQ93540.1 putative transposon-encoded protein with Ribonuclease H-like domain and integrase-like domain [Klebsormidium nitens]
MSLFETLEIFDGSGREFSFGYKGTLWAGGSGSVELLCATPTEDCLVTLQNVISGSEGDLRSRPGGERTISKSGSNGAAFGNEAGGRHAGGGRVLPREKAGIGRAVAPTDGARRYENLAKMVQDNLVEVVGVKPGAFRALKFSVCEPCIMGKQTRLPFSESESVSMEPLELVHMDVCGPMPVPSVGGSRYFATFLDDYSKLSVVVPMKQKSEVAKVTEHVIQRLESQSGKKLKSVGPNGGKEYVNKALRDVFGGKGTVHEKTAFYTAEQNGSAERLNRQ